MHGTNRNDAVVAPTAALSLSTLQMQTTRKDDVNDIDKEGPDAAIVIYNLIMNNSGPSFLKIYYQGRTNSLILLSV